MVFKQPDTKEFEQIKQLVEELWLDNENMQPGQFRVLSDNGKVIAFGRLRKHSDATEICSVGVATDFQKRGFGKKIVEHLLQQANGEIYLVTVVPDFFAKIGFKKVDKYPDSLKHKVEICSTEYHVQDPYFVMKWEKKKI